MQRLPQYSVLQIHWHEAQGRAEPRLAACTNLRGPNVSRVHAAHSEVWNLTREESINAGITFLPWDEHVSQRQYGPKRAAQELRRFRENDNRS